MAAATTVSSSSSAAAAIGERRLAEVAGLVIVTVVAARVVAAAATVAAGRALVDAGEAATTGAVEVSWEVEAAARAEEEVGVPVEEVVAGAGSKTHATRRVVGSASALQ